MRWVLKMKTVKLSPIKMSDGMERLSELQKEVNEKYAANKKLYRSSGRGQWNKKAVEIMNKCMENNSEQQIIIKNASKKLTKEILETGIGKQIKIKEHTPLGNIPIYYNEIKKPIKVIKKGYKFTKGFLKLKQEPVFDVEFCLGKNALKEYLKPAKKKRIPRTFNAKKLQAKHTDLWNEIQSAVKNDICLQGTNRDEFISDETIRAVSHNAAFTAIVEMIKRGLL